MLQTLSPYSTTTKTAEIMSRYRPIAPKPEIPLGPVCDAPSMSQKISQSPYLRNVWPHLQARPTRTRKRGRTALAPTTIKRIKTSDLLNIGISPLPLLPTVPALTATTEVHSNFVTLPLLPPSSSLPIKAAAIDLNIAAESLPEEKDLLHQLQRHQPSATVITPQPVRPVGSSISVGCISEDPKAAAAGEQCRKKREEVEEEVESEALPAVVSDSNNKVRMANSAYREMVGQPECSWMDSMVSCACKRISGEVLLRFLDSSRVPVASSNGFSCWVRIEWGSDGKKSSINAFSDVIRLCCDSKDYLFAWRFHTGEASESCSNV